MYQIICSGMNNPFREMARPSWDGSLTENQQRLMDAVKKALLAGVFYNSDMYDFVKRELADILTPDVFDDVTSNTHKVEYGKFGTDIYNCRKFVEAQLREQANKDAVTVLTTSGLIRLGSTIKDVRYGQMKFSTCKVIDITESTIAFECTRKGNRHRYRIELGGNDTRLLEKLVSTIQDKRVVATEHADGTSTLMIDPTANRHSEFTCQLALN